MVSEISVRGHLVPAESTLWRQRERKRDKERVIKRRHIERERGGKEEKYTLQRHANIDLLPPTRPYLLKFPLPPNTPLSYEFINGLIHL
jgi:hypothetical protein